MTIEPTAGVIVDFNLVSFALSAVSLVQGGFAIWLAYKLKQDADRTNEQARRTLVEIHADAQVIAAFGLQELRKYGDLTRQIISNHMTSGGGTISFTPPGTKGGENAS